MAKFYDETEMKLVAEEEIEGYVRYKVPSELMLKEMNDMTLDECQKFMLRFSFVWGKQLEEMGFVIIETGVRRPYETRDINNPSTLQQRRDSSSD